MCKFRPGLGLVFLCSIVLPITGCEKVGDAADSARETLPLVVKSSDWRDAALPDGAGISKEGEDLVLLAGTPMTGAVTSLDPKSLPVVNYRIRYQAMREEGLDFFSSLTFPVVSADTCLTLILGGWGGGLVGLSSLNDMDASENSTRSEQRFENGKWYAIEVEVTSEFVRATIDGRPVVNALIAGKRVGLRAGAIERCAPLGFASWRTQCRVRNFVIEAIPPTEE